MNTKTAIIISPMPLHPIKSGMQNTINLLCKFLREKNYKIFFFEIKTNSKIDPILDLKKKRKYVLKLKKKIKEIKNLKFIFVNTSKVLFQYKSLLLNKKRNFKTVLACHDLYYFRKKYFDKIRIKDKTNLKNVDEVNILKKTDYIIDFKKTEFDFMLKNKISLEKLKKTYTPTLKFKKINFSKKKYDLLYVSSNWLQNHHSMKNFLKKIDKTNFAYNILVLGNLKLKKQKNIDVKPYSKKMFNKCKIGLAVMKDSTGRQTKIFEMLSAGLPVFTNIDLAEFGLKKDKHYKFFDKKKNLVNEIKTLNDDESLRKKLSQNAYNWSLNNTFYRKAFKSLNQILARN